jgi:predicted metal-dependent HD superfamily phosphohydrolase
MFKQMSNAYDRDLEYCGLAATSWFHGTLRDHIISEMNAEGRYYHTFKHCLSLASHFTVDVNRDIAEDKIPGVGPQAGWMDGDWDELADIVMPAICFHDIVYDAARGDNEERSAHQAFLYLPAGLFIDQIQNAILATKTHEAKSFAEKVMCDIDMQILAAHWPTYLKYARDVRREYIHVPFDAYVTGRSQFLDKTLGKPIFNLPLTLCNEESARYNIERELYHLKHQPKEFLLA